MNTEEEFLNGNVNSIPVEFEYLKKLIDFRISGTNKPDFPEITQWQEPIRKFLNEYHLNNNKDAALILLIALAPHAYPALFDSAIQDKIKTSGDFPDIGGVRGKNFRGFLPTGQSAVFLLAGNNWNKRKEVEKLFWSDFTFAKKKILWLEELPQGEPMLSGKVILALDYCDLLLFGTTAPPHFSMNFPAKKIETPLSSKDIVMSKDVHICFEEMERWIRFNTELFDKWSMKDRLRSGFRVLFHGPPGTGKTLTAKVLGNETGKIVYKIDLSMVVSKYIGETEKNLELLFARAEDKDWILFFDEADALFGKRTGVRDAHDRYANQEVSYLLQRIEDYNGLVILATNMKSNIDTAFIRRFNEIVKFEIPDANERLDIWKLSFPENSTFYNGIDLPRKVMHYELTGGNISNVIHYAGLLAIERQKKKTKKEILVSEDGDECSEHSTEKEEKLVFYLEDVLEGIKREMIKEGKPFQT